MTPPASPTFGSMLRRFRRAAGLSQEELAALAGLSTHAVGDLERGYRCRPHQDTVALLVEALKLPDQDRALLEAAVRRSRGMQAGISPSTRALTALMIGVLPGGANVPLPEVNTGHHSHTVPPLIGRDQPLAVCEGHLAQGDYSFLLLAGEPGVGKTRLLYEVSRRALARGWRVLAVRCHRVSSPEPYGPLLDLISQTLVHQTPSEQRASLQDCGWLVNLLPEVDDMVMGIPAAERRLGISPGRRLISTAMARFLRNISGPAGVLLLIDDLHLADTDTVELLSYLMRATPLHTTLRVIGAYRHTDIDSSPGLTRRLADLISMQITRHLTLAPLSDVDAAVLLDHLLPEQGEMQPRWWRERLLRRTGGIPFYLIHCANELQFACGAPSRHSRDSSVLGLPPTSSGGKHADRDRCNVPLPWMVVESVHHRLTALSVPGYETDQIVAAAGGRISGSLLLRVLIMAGHAEHLAVAGIEGAFYARILLEEDDRHTYRFAHLLIQDVVVADLSAARRCMLERLIAAAVRASDES
jgi:DNA-binding XRE family transcriptional regulator/DNA polymerase III delta prime subunit